MRDAPSPGEEEFVYRRPDLGEPACHHAALRQALDEESSVALLDDAAVEDGHRAPVLGVADEAAEALLEAARLILAVAEADDVISIDSLKLLE
jgi:hypothetical protein